MHRVRVRLVLAAGLLASTVSCPAIAGGDAQRMGAGAGEASPVQVATTGLSASETAASHALLDDAWSRLPAGWQAGLRASPRRLEVSWSRELPARVHGRYRSGRIVLDRRLLDGWIARSRSGTRGSLPSAGLDARLDPEARPALAALLHEWAHALDRGPAGGLSRDPRLLDLAGWARRPVPLDLLAFGRRGPRNPRRDRSPDRYELTHPREFLAVNLEHAVLDPEYACRRPAVHGYLRERLGPLPRMPWPAPPCPGAHPFLRAEGTTGGSPLIQLKPDRVFAVDYLFAEANQEPMSRWGHGMLRLVVCAPGRTPGPDCRLDLEHHLVLSFRAFVDDVRISAWRGLSGGYPSRLFVLPLSQVVEEYTRVELRGLQSVPLRLTRSDIGGLLEHAAQLHWTYDGRYYFVSNNCAVETYRLLYTGVPRLGRQRLRSMTPRGLLRGLARTGQADPTVLEDRDTAIRQGYYFESQEAHYAAVYEVARTRLGLPQDDVRDWFALRPERREPWLARGDLRATAALLLLEQAALRREQARAREWLQHRWIAEDTARDPLAAWLDLQDRFTRPARLLAGGYGIPQAEELRELTQQTDALAQRRQADTDRLRDAARALLPDATRRALEASEANLTRLGERLRRLHRGAAGHDAGQAGPPASFHAP